MPLALSRVTKSSSKAQTVCAVNIYLYRMRCKQRESGERRYPVGGEKANENGPKINVPHSLGIYKYAA